MKIRQILIIVIVALTAVLTSCSGDGFKIDGNIAAIKGTMVRVVFDGDSGIVDELVNVDNKVHFTYEGESAQPVLVSILDMNGNQLMTVVAVNGDHIKMKGDAGKAMSIKAKGSKVNEDWQLFRDEHKAFYTDPNPSRLDAAIEKYVREHPADMLSTVLLMADYSNYTDADKVGKLLNSIQAEARPESLTRAFLGNPMGHKNPSVPRLMTLTLVKHGGDFEEIKLTDKMTLISLWANPQDDRNTKMQKLRELSEGTETQFRIIDVLAEADTVRWHQTIASDPKSWQHYWAPGGPLEQGIQMLGINTMPWYAVTDSTGLVTYSGPSLDQAIKAATPRP